jgi:hypothetical protein
MEFRTDTIFDALKGPLGVVDSPERRKQLEDYIDAARLGLESSVFDMLSRFADSVNGQVAAHYQVDLTYRPGVLNLDVREREPTEPEGETWSTAEGDVEKVTLRIPGELKDLATEAAAKSGLSLNSWFVRMMARALRSADEPDRHERRERRRESRHGGGGGGSRLTGWVGGDE